MALFARPSRREEHRLDRPLLRVNDVEVRYETQRALERVSFQLKTGERAAVVGPNGAGKSTLFRLIAGLLKPDRGQVQVYGQHPSQHGCIAYVPQRTTVDWRFPVNVTDVVMMGRTGQLGLLRRPGPEDHKRVQRCLELMGLTPLAHRQIDELSGGQQQRMFIARALAQEAELLLMDEPLSGLDVPSQQDILGVLDALHTQGVTAFVALHDLDLAAKHFDKILLLNRRLIAFGAPSEVLVAGRIKDAYGGAL